MLRESPKRDTETGSEQTLLDLLDRFAQHKVSTNLQFIKIWYLQSTIK